MSSSSPTQRKILVSSTSLTELWFHWEGFPKVGRFSVRKSMFRLPGVGGNWNLDIKASLDIFEKKLWFFFFYHKNQNSWSWRVLLLSYHLLLLLSFAEQLCATPVPAILSMLFLFIPRTVPKGKFYSLVLKIRKLSLQ